MRRRTKALLLSIPFILLFSLLGLARHAGLYINMTASLPMGIYKVTLIDAQNAEIKVNDLVMIPPSEYEETGIDSALNENRAMIKKAAALAGDVIDSDGQSIYINGSRLEYSNIYEKDKFNQTLPAQQYPYRVPQNSVYITSEHPYGYDSRYFGPIDLKHIKGRARIVFRFPFQKRDYSDIENQR